MSSRNAFFLPPSAFREKWVTIADKNIAHQIRRVLRLKIGDPFIALGENGKEYHCIIHDMEKGTITGQILETQTYNRELVTSIALYPALIRRERFTLILEKCTELGVTEFTPVVAARSPFSSVTENLEKRWLHIIREAAELVRRGRLPTLHSPQTLQDVLRADSAGTLALVCGVSSGESMTSQQLLEQLQRGRPSRIHLFIGPEGDYTQEEYAAFHDAGYTMLSLGPRIVRSETAAIAAVSILTTVLV